MSIYTKMDENLDKETSVYALPYVFSNQMFKTKVI